MTLTETEVRRLESERFRLLEQQDQIRREVARLDGISRQLVEGDIILAHDLQMAREADKAAKEHAEKEVSKVDERITGNGDVTHEDAEA